jgi:hypothetical protein
MTGNGTPNETDLFQEWRRADRAASAAEKAFMTDSMLAIDGKAAIPSDQERGRVRQMRALANDLFHLAMVEMQKRAAAARH